MSPTGTECVKTLMPPSNYCQTRDDNNAMNRSAVLRGIRMDSSITALRLSKTLSRSDTMAESAIESFVNDRLIGSNQYLSPAAAFQCSAIIYKTPLLNSFVQTVIDGISRPASFPNQNIAFPYRQLISSVRTLTPDEPSFAFYGRDPDNALSMLSWVRPCTFEQVHDALASFELAPAEQGGDSWLGFTGKSTKWMILHELTPGESFNIVAYGTKHFCRELTLTLGIDHTGSTPA